MPIQSLTPEQVCEQAKKKVSDSDKVIKEINQQLIYRMKNNPENKPLNIGGEGHSDNIRWPDKQGKRISIRSINLAMKQFRKDWEIRLVGTWNSQYSHLEFTPKK